MRKRAMLLAVLFMVGIMAYPCYAMRRHFMIPMMKWWELPSISSKLNLKDQEKEALNKLLIEKRSKLIDLEAKIRKEKFQLKDMLDNKDLNENAFNQALDLLSKAQSDLIKTRFEYMLGVRKILGFKRFELMKEAIMMMHHRIKKKALKHEHGLPGHHRHRGKWTK